MTQNAKLPYSPARKAGNFIFTAGQIGRDPETLEAKAGIEDQMHQTMKNLKLHLENNGASFSDVIKINIYLTNMDDYEKCNEIYAQYVTEPYPARTAIAVKELPRVADVDLVVEIDAVAFVQ
ncbi:MAG: RidA family protein [Acidimicrobiia bacterium]